LGWYNGWYNDREGNAMALTVKELQALTTADKGRNLTDGGSLKGKVYVSREGEVTVHFRFAYKFDKASKNIAVGTWPSLSIAQIRKSRDAFRTQLVEARKTNALDPIGLRRKNAEDAAEAKKIEDLRKVTERESELFKIEVDRQENLLTQQKRLQNLAAQQARVTVREMFDLWKQLDLVSRADKGEEAERSFKRDVFPLLGDMAAADVTKAHVQEIVDTVKARATVTRNMVRTAKKTLAELRQMFGFALDREYIDTDPTARIKKAKIGKDVERDRILSEQELILFFQKLPNGGMAETSQIALLLQLATIARIGEILSARWEHIDFERRLWVLPVTKNGKRHEVWLSDFTYYQLEKLKEITGSTPWLYPAARAKKDQPDVIDHVCEKTVTKQVSDRQRAGRVPMSGRSKNVDALVLLEGKWTPHDLRRTGATLMAELGALPDVVEKCLNHTEEKKIKRIYQRAQYESQMRDAWLLLGARLELLAARGCGNVKNVTTLKAA
jgi:integrase